MQLIEQIMSDGNLAEATEVVRRNKGAAGIDRILACVAREYMEEHKAGLRKAVINGVYRPQAVRRTYIPKPDGRKRPLGIPTVADRVLQTATKQALEPIFEAGFSDNSHGFRPGRGEHDAVFKMLGYLNDGYTWVIDWTLRNTLTRSAMIS